MPKVKYFFSSWSPCCWISCSSDKIERERSHTRPAGTTTPGMPGQSRPVLWAHVVLFLVHLHRQNQYSSTSKTNPKAKDRPRRHHRPTPGAATE
ncbi:hypothetical protein BDR03DRAFT_953887 [Suillus americanus]|nr:hypothetical protein BDR03DRAFT_953887 [Suillus americanus]